MVHARHPSSSRHLETAHQDVEESEAETLARIDRRLAALKAAKNRLVMFKKRARRSDDGGGQQHSELYADDIHQSSSGGLHMSAATSSAGGQLQMKRISVETFDLNMPNQQVRTTAKYLYV